MNSKRNLFKEAQCINESLLTGFILYSLCKLLALSGVCYLQGEKEKRFNNERQIQVFMNVAANTLFNH